MLNSLLALFLRAGAINQFKGFEFAYTYAIAATGTFIGIFHHDTFPVFIAYQIQYIVFTFPHVRQATLTSGTIVLNDMDYFVFSLLLTVNSANQP
jgi:hypothetical protein